jgi:hypothetical protein
LVAGIFNGRSLVCEDSDVAVSGENSSGDSDELDEPDISVNSGVEVPGNLAYSDALEFADISVISNDLVTSIPAKIQLLDVYRSRNNVKVSISRFIFFYSDANNA